MKARKRKAGRPALPKAQVKNVVAIRLTDEEKEAYQRKANGKGVRLSEWIREALQHAVEQC